MARLGMTASGLSRDDLSDDQVKVYDQVIEWLSKEDRQYLRLGGLAGTGKTTVVSVLAQEMQKRSRRVVFGAYTGKAANVLGRKLKNAGISADCGTLHSLMYDLVTHDHDDPRIDCIEDRCDRIGRIERWDKKLSLDAGLVVVDEASMIGEEIWKDLLSFGVPVLAVGDHGQLPPIGANAINLMHNPDLRLEKIHRQAEGNPIIRLAHLVRGGGDIYDFQASDDRVQYGEAAADKLINDAKSIDELFDLGIIVGRNDTRIEMNANIREQLGYEGSPGADDIVICLKNFKTREGGAVYNGMRGVIESVEEGEGKFKGVVRFPDDRIRVRGEFCHAQFGRSKTFDHPKDVQVSSWISGNDEAMPARSWSDTGLLFDYGFAMTCHKAQGSQFSKVILMASEGFGKTEDEARRWTYTAITRASERLVII